VAGVTSNDHWSLEPMSISRVDLGHAYRATEKAEGA